MNRVTLCENSLDPSTWQTFESVIDLPLFLVNHFVEWPKTAHIYLDHVAKNADITPFDDAGIERLRKVKNGHFFVVVYPEGLETIAIIIAVAVSVVSIGLSFLLRPSLPAQKNVQADSANNHLSDRQNQARPNERIPDIFGELWATPDLIAVPYRVFTNTNTEVEYSFLCLGRGSYDIAIIREDVTDVNDIPGYQVEVYGPNTSPNSGDVPQLSVGAAIATLLNNLQKFGAVNGQILLAPNDPTVVGGANWSQWFILLFPDTTELWCNFVCPQGAYKIDSSGTQFAAQIDIDVEYQAVDVAGVPFGTVYTQTKHLTGSTADKQQKGMTMKITLPVGLAAFGGVQIRAHRTSNEDHSPGVQVSAQIQFRDLYFISPLTQTDFGNVTTVQIVVQPTVAALAIQERKLNMLVTRQVPTLISGGSPFLPPTGTVDDLMQWWLFANRTTQHLDGTLHNWCFLDPDGLKFWRIKDISGHPWDINTYDNTGAPTDKIYFWNTENGDEVGGFGTDTAYKRFTAPVPLFPRFFDTAGPQVTILASAPNDVVRTMTCETDGEPIIHIGHAKGTTDPPVAIAFGGSVGTQLCIVCTYYYSGTGSIYNARERFYLVKDLGVVKWDVSAWTGSGYGPPSQTSLNNMIVAGGAPAPAFPCAATIGASFLGGAVPTLASQNVLGLPGGGGTGGGGFGGGTGSKNAADIICAMALDPYIGNRTLAELDVAEIYAVAGPGGLVETYFNILNYPSSVSEFCYTFDDKAMSWEESINAVAQAIFCTAFRRGTVLSLSFEQATLNSVMLFNHRNKLPNSETRTLSFGSITENDGINLDYVEPNAPNYPEQDTTTTLYFPPDQSAVNPKKITAIGVRNLFQALILGWRLYQKLIGQFQSVQFEATEESALLVNQDRILVADNTRSDTQDGEVIDQVVLQLTLSQDVIFDPAFAYTIYLQNADETVEAIPITAGATPNKVVLGHAPTLPCVIDPLKYARTTYVIVNDAPTASNAFLLQEKTPKDGRVFEIKGVNYSDAYYVHDFDQTNPIVIIPPPPPPPLLWVGPMGKAIFATSGKAHSFNGHTATAGTWGVDYNGLTWTWETVTAGANIDSACKTAGTKPSQSTNRRLFVYGMDATGAIVKTYAVDPWPFCSSQYDSPNGGADYNNVCMMIFPFRYLSVDYVLIQTTMQFTGPVQITYFEIFRTDTLTKVQSYAVTANQALTGGYTGYTYRNIATSQFFASVDTVNGVVHILQGGNINNGVNTWFDWNNIESFGIVSNSYTRNLIQIGTNLASDANWPYMMVVDNNQAKLILVCLNGDIRVHTITGVGTINTTPTITSGLVDAANGSLFDVYACAGAHKGSIDQINDCFYVPAPLVGGKTALRMLQASTLTVIRDMIPYDQWTTGSTTRLTTYDVRAWAMYAGASGPAIVMTPVSDYPSAGLHAYFKLETDGTFVYTLYAIPNSPGSTNPDARALDIAGPGGTTYDVLGFDLNNPGYLILL